MIKFAGYIGSFVGGTIGWWLGNFFGLMAAFMLSMVGTGLGMYYGRRIADLY